MLRCIIICYLGYYFIIWTNNKISLLDINDLLKNRLNGCKPFSKLQNLLAGSNNVTVKTTAKDVATSFVQSIYVQLQYLHYIALYTLFILL